MFSLSEKILQYFKKLNNEKGEVVPASLTDVNDDSDKEKEAFKSELIKLNSDLEGKSGKISLEEMTYEPLTKEEIEQKAKLGVEEKYELKKNALDSEYEDALKTQEEKVNSVLSSANAKKEEISNLYDDLEEKLGANAIKRGISRSTIVSEQIRNLSTEKIKDLLKVDDSVASELKINEDKIEGLKKDYQTAVNSLNIEKAVEISDNIEKLTKEQNDKIEEVLKYNNTLKKEEASVNNNVKPATEIEISRIKNEILKQAINYYSKLPKDERLSAFENDEDIKKLLGDQATLVERYIKAME